MYSVGLAQEAKPTSVELRLEFESSNFESVYNKLLCNRWEFKYAFVDHTKLKKLPGNRYFDVLFETNGNYELIDRNNQIEKGKWTFVQDENSVYLKSYNGFKANVKSIEKNELVFTMLPENSDPIAKNIQIHFRPFNY